MQYIKDYEVGEVFTSFLVLRSKELRTTRNGQPYLVVELGDRSGRLFGNIWEDAEAINDELVEGGIVKVQGAIERYQGRKQISVRRIRKTTEEDEYSLDDFIPRTDVDPEYYVLKLQTIARQVKNTYLKNLLENFFTDEEFSLKFSRAPGGKLWHHNRIGGLAEHTLSLVRICRVLARLYPEVDKDLLVAGAILHDIGKMEEYNYITHIDFSDRGRLVGHITLGAQWVSELAADINGFPADLLDRLTHLVLSHQAEHGSPVQPAIPEAFLLHYADEIDSKMDAFRRIKKDRLEGEKWTWVNLLERHIDLGKD